jgi:hypothetical protein
MVAAEMLVLCIAVSASDEDGVVRSADDPTVKKRSTVQTTTMSPSTAQSSRHASRILVIFMLINASIMAEASSAENCDEGSGAQTLGPFFFRRCLLLPGRVPSAKREMEVITLRI